MVLLIACGIGLLTGSGVVLFNVAIHAIQATRCRQGPRADVVPLVGWGVCRPASPPACHPFECLRRHLGPPLHPCDCDVAQDVAWGGLLLSRGGSWARSLPKADLWPLVVLPPILGVLSPVNPPTHCQQKSAPDRKHTAGHFC